RKAYYFKYDGQILKRIYYSDHKDFYLKNINEFESKCTNDIINNLKLFFNKNSINNYSEYKSYFEIFEFELKWKNEKPQDKLKWYNLDKLKILASQKNIKNYNKMKKIDLIKLLK